MPGHYWDSISFLMVLVQIIRERQMIEYLIT